ncbi:MAG: hypothetical protein N3G19_00835 [Candidatus Pacearchaeota archaeon]|nr:hypothetical protein [Candidatus Pacearchaeota archaeon]
MFKEEGETNSIHGRKAQVTLFIIIAAILVAIALLAVLYFKPLTNLVKQDITKPVYEDLRLCIREKAIDGLFELGKQGGYSNISSPFGYYYEITLPFLFKGVKRYTTSPTFIIFVKSIKFCVLSVRTPSRFFTGLPSLPLFTSLEG